MNTRRLFYIALPLSVALAGCESAPMKDMQRMLGSIMPSSDQSQSAASNPTPVKPIPPQVIVAPEPPTATQTQSTASTSNVSRGSADLEAGVRKYEDGVYGEASARLHSAIKSGLTQSEAVRAHKYLAFIHCASKRERQCRSEFRKALALDPGFQLNAAEVGHPIWGPVFRDVKQHG